MSVNDMSYYDTLQIANIEYRLGTNTYSVLEDKKCRVTLNENVKPNTINESEKVMWQDFARSHEVAHCAFPKEWNNWKKRHVLDEKFYHPFFQKIEESYADAYAISFVKKKYAHKAVSFLYKIQQWRESAHDYHGNSLVFNTDYVHLPLMEQAISSAYDSSAMDRMSIRNNNAFELIHALSLYKLQSKLGFEGMPDLNSVSTSFYELTINNAWPKHLLTLNPVTNTYSVNQKVLLHWKKELEKQPWYIQKNNVFIREKEDIWNELSEYVYHNEKSP